MSNESMKSMLNDSIARILSVHLFFKYENNNIFANHLFCNIRNITIKNCLVFAYQDSFFNKS